jgi:hypothetical protein
MRPDYTPAALSEELISWASIPLPRSVADFCAGEGSLLCAASGRWPLAYFYANDIDPLVKHSIKSIAWDCFDFLSDQFPDPCAATSIGAFDLVLLNPPFSDVKSSVKRPRGRFSGLSCSNSFAFLLTALDYVAQDGELLAVLPTSTLKSERDSHARALLRRNFLCRVLAEPSYDRFPGLDVSTYLVSVRPKRSKASLSYDFTQQNVSGAQWSISRGKISVPRADREVFSGAGGWIHTSSIRSSCIATRYAFSERTLGSTQQVVEAGSVLIPRVGKVTPGGITVISEPEIISDCLFGISFDDGRMSEVLVRAIREDFPSFRSIYAGTGAPYTTVSRVSRFISSVL